MASHIGVVKMGNEIQEEDICEKQEGWDASDVGKRIPKRVTSQGTYFNEMIVEVFCQMCGASFIGPTREAGGFLGGHECMHAWEISQIIGREDGLHE